MAGNTSTNVTAGALFGSVGPHLVDRVGPSHPAPIHIRLPQLPPCTRADDALCALLALHASAIQHNLECVLSSVDANGPHQLRVSLRRLRVLLQTFQPVMRRTINERFTVAARALGAIVGELRDADVVIEEHVRPAAGSAYPGMVAALDAWRQEVRGRVRAQLRAAYASEFASDLVSRDRRVEWRKKARPPLLATEVSDHALARAWVVAKESGANLPDLSQAQLHKFRKDIKALRYGAEIAAATEREHEAVSVGRPLKRMQDTLGVLNDLATLERFDPPLGEHRTALTALRNRLISEHATNSRAFAVEAADRWRALGPWQNHARLSETLALLYFNAAQDPTP